MRRIQNGAPILNIYWHAKQNLRGFPEVFLVAMELGKRENLLYKQAQ